LIVLARISAQLVRRKDQGRSRGTPGWTWEGVEEEPAQRVVALADLLGAVKSVLLHVVAIRLPRGCCASQPPPFWWIS